MHVAKGHTVRRPLVWYFFAANVVGFLFNASVLGLKFASLKHRTPLADVKTSVLCVASFSLVLCLAGAVLAFVRNRRALVAYAFSTLIVLSFYTYVIVLCFVAPAQLPVGHGHERAAAGLGIVVCLLTAPCVYVAAALAGRAWTAQTLGAACSVTSLAVSVTLLAFGIAGSGTRVGAPAAGAVISAACFELIDCLVGIPMFWFQWNRVLTAHAAWSVLSAVMLVVGASVALAADDVYVFTSCKKPALADLLSPPPSPWPPSPFPPAPPPPLPPLPPLPPMPNTPPALANLSTPGVGRKLLLNATEVANAVRAASPAPTECSEHELQLMGALAAVTLVVSIADIACSAVLILKNRVVRPEDTEVLVEMHQP